MVASVSKILKFVVCETAWRRDHPRRAFTGISGAAIIAAARDKASEHFLEFFAATIRNKNTRAAYVQAAAQFFGWCEQYDLRLASIRPLHVSAYIESKALTAPSIKQHLAALRGLFNWLVIKQVVSENPALFVKGPKFSRKIGVTPIMEAKEVRALLDSIPLRGASKCRRNLVGVYKDKTGLSRMFQELLSRWEPHRGLTGPAPTPIELWRAEGRIIAIGNGWGPAVPYPAVNHRNGHQNYGYVRIKNNMDVLELIPEARDWPELQKFLAMANADTSPVESVGCEKAYSPANIPGGPPVQLGAYFNIIFTEVALNDCQENALLLASHLFQAVEGCAEWWSGIEIELERFRAVSGAVAPWGLLLRVLGYGLNNEDARRRWSKTMDLLAKAMAELPRNFRWQ
jgi:hypothetical protein